MCYDISYQTNLESLFDYFPDRDFEGAELILAQSYKIYPTAINDDGQLNLNQFEWGVIADYINTPEKIKDGRQWMCTAQNERSWVTANLTGTGSEISAV